MARVVSIDEIRPGSTQEIVCPRQTVQVIEFVWIGLVPYLTHCQLRSKSRLKGGCVDVGCVYVHPRGKGECPFDFWGQVVLGIVCKLRPEVPLPSVDDKSKQEFTGETVMQTQKIKLGCLGPAGTFSVSAARRYFAYKGLEPNDYELVLYTSIPELLEAFGQGLIEMIVAPFENAAGAFVYPTVNFFVVNAATNLRLRIVCQVEIPIKHMLLGKAGACLEDIKSVVTHHQPRGQCERILAQHPEWEIIDAPSTAAAAKMVAESDQNDLAAIASPEAATEYDRLEVILADIGDLPASTNVTRFLILGADAPKPNGNDQTTIFFKAPNKPGGLMWSLLPFWLLGVNLGMIVSWTAKKQLGDYVFFIDAAGHIKKSRRLRLAIWALKKIAINVVVIGSYPIIRNRD
ncbi:MAG: prephenate dehydratase domain-containing protein [Patescibacteria group bacterium]